MAALGLFQLRPSRPGRTNTAVMTHTCTRAMVVSAWRACAWHAWLRPHRNHPEGSDGNQAAHELGLLRTTAQAVSRLAAEHTEGSAHVCDGRRSNRSSRTMRCAALRDPPTVMFMLSIMAMTTEFIGEMISPVDAPRMLTAPNSLKCAVRALAACVRSHTRCCSFRRGRRGDRASAPW